VGKLQNRDGFRICGRGRTVASAECGHVTEVWRHSSQRGQGAEPLVRARPPEAESLLSMFIQRGERFMYRYLSDSPPGLYPAICFRGSMKLSGGTIDEARRLLLTATIHPYF